MKSREEFLWIRRAAQLTDDAHAALPRETRGMREYELLEVIERTYPHDHAETQVAFLGSTPMTRPHLCLPSQFPSGRTLEAGDMILTELSVACHGYPAQALRTFAVATEPPAEVWRMHAVAEEAYARLAGALRAGTGTEDVLAATDVVAEEGLAMVDGSVHGFSIGVPPPVICGRQAPWAAALARWVFRENETVVIQPNVVGPDHRVGDLCVVTRTGAVSLHNYTREFIVCRGQRARLIPFGAQERPRRGRGTPPDFALGSRARPQDYLTLPRSPPAPARPPGSGTDPGSSRWPCRRRTP